MMYKKLAELKRRIDSIDINECDKELLVSDIDGLANDYDESKLEEILNDTGFVYLNNFPNIILEIIQDRATASGLDVSDYLVSLLKLGEKEILEFYYRNK